MTRAPDLKIKQIGILPCCGPQNLTLNAKWSQNLARLCEVTLHFRSGNSHLAFIIPLLAVVPGFGKAPSRMVQEQTADGKQPQEQKQKQSSVEMQFAVQTLESGPESRPFRRFDWSYWCSGGGYAPL